MPGLARRVREGARRRRREDRIVAALKAYRPVEDEWYDYPPTGPRARWNSPEDHEVDGERGALLLKWLPRGLPESAWDVL